LWITESNAE